MALGHRSLISRYLESGRLVKPFDLILPSNHYYWFVCPRENLERPKVRAFRDWLVETIEADPSANLH